MPRAYFGDPAVRFGSLSEHSPWPRPNGFAFSRGGADEVGLNPMRRRQRRMKANPSGPFGLAHAEYSDRLLIWNNLSSADNSNEVILSVSRPSTRGQRPGQQSSTVDHSDIRGSSARPAIMVVIRRELPRTKIAGPAKKACRIGAHEDSPLPCAIPAADPWCLYRVHVMWIRA